MVTNVYGTEYVYIACTPVDLQFVKLHFVPVLERMGLGFLVRQEDAIWTADRVVRVNQRLRDANRYLIVVTDATLRDSSIRAEIDWIIRYRPNLATVLRLGKTRLKGVHPQIEILDRMDLQSNWGEEDIQGLTDRLTEKKPRQVSKDTETTQDATQLTRAKDLKMIQVAQKHINYLSPVYGQMDYFHDTYFTDKSFLYGDYGAILRPELVVWQLFSSTENARYQREGKRPIRRIAPLLRKDYSLHEIDLIKYNFHFQMSLGMECVVFFTDDNLILDRNTASDNLVIIRNVASISCPHFYWDDNDVLAIVENKDKVNTLHAYCHDVSIDADSITMKYNSQSYSSVDVDLKRLFGRFLFQLQSGKCALTKQPLDRTGWRVVKVFDAEGNGNNTLINCLAVADTKEARNIRDELAREGKLRLALSAEIMKTYQIDSIWHLQLCDRGLQQHPISPRALDYLNPSFCLYNALTGKS
ncbi:MAG: hypothetical protein C5B53_06750 [Candidatus Melainabacteria bacterium]|nr:MAG: hypothetical protein C5B53_06750 [Candidatus Melainabacteria bacterium]